MTALSTFTALTGPAAQYELSNLQAAHERDGRQQLALGMIATTRLRVLASHLRPAFGQINTYGAIYLPLGMGALVGLGKPAAEAYLRKPVDQQNGAIRLLSKATVQLSKGSEFILKHSNKLINVACAVSYVALIAFGCPVAGIAGLTGLLLIAVKRAGYMPPMLDRILSPIAILGMLAADITLPAPLIFRVIQLIFYGNAISKAVMECGPIRRLLPNVLSNPEPGRHAIRKDRALLDTLPLATIEQICTDPDELTVNRSSFHAPEVATLLPNDLNGNDERSLAQVFEALETSIQSHDLGLSEHENEGLSKLKRGLVTGRTTDLAPSHIDRLQTIMRHVVISVLNDEVNLGVKVRDLAAVGHSCVEGWPRDLNALLLPKTKDPRWAVHHQLAVLRGELVKQLIPQLNERMRELFRMQNADLAGMMGGANNVHLTNAMQAALWHRYRPYEGEVYLQLNERTFFEALFLNYCRIKKLPERDQMPFVERMYIANKMSEIHPGCVIGTNVISALLHTLDADVSDAQRLTNRIEDAITPQYATGTDQVADVHRDIPWEAVQEWMADFQGRFEEVPLLLDDGSYDPRWIVTDALGMHRLTQAGVRLMLWDMGVLEAINPTG